MATSKNKTVATDNSVDAYLAGIADEQRRNDCKELVKQFQKATKYEPKMWGTAIIGFGTYHYTYDSGREGDAPLAGLSSRANAIVLYLSANFEGREALLEQLGKHKTGKGCVYVKKLEDIDLKVLAEMIKRSVQHTKQLYPG
jgi:hypothetical protein